MEMVKHGILTLEEARHHEDKNVILRAVGTQPAVEIEISEPFPLITGDEFLLCSDGLTDMLSDEEIEATWLKANDIYSIGEELIELAKQKGGHDNITVGIVYLSPNGKNVTGETVRVTREIGGLAE
jgi:protein phosphatase